MRKLSTARLAISLGLILALSFTSYTSLSAQITSVSCGTPLPSGCTNDTSSGTDPNTGLPNSACVDLGTLEQFVTIGQNALNNAIAGGNAGPVTLGLESCCVVDSNKDDDDCMVSYFTVPPEGGCYTIAQVNSLGSGTFALDCTYGTDYLGETIQLSSGVHEFLFCPPGGSGSKRLGITPVFDIKGVATAPTCAGGCDGVIDLQACVWGDVDLVGTAMFSLDALGGATATGNAGGSTAPGMDPCYTDDAVSAGDWNLYNGQFTDLCPGTYMLYAYDSGDLNCFSTTEIIIPEGTGGVADGCLPSCADATTDLAAFCNYLIANPTSAIATADCDGGGVDNLTECQNGTDPADSGDDCDLVSNGTIDVCALLLTDPTNPLATADCDGDGVNNADECAAGTDPSDPCSNSFASGADLCTYILANPTSPLALADCDGSGVDNLTECQNGGDPLAPGDDCDLVMDGTVDVCALLLADPTNPLALVDCDEDGIDNAMECAAGTSPTDPCENTYATGADLCAFILANPTSPLALADCDGGGVDNLTECMNGGDPLITGDDCMLISDGTIDVCTLLLTDPTNPLATVDCDMDGETNADECTAGTNPIDPCSNSYASGADLCAYILANPMSMLATADCDGGGINNLTECMNGGDPLDNTDDCTFVSGSVVDICEILMTDPTNPLATEDCDMDGETNEDECLAGTNPTDPCSNSYASGADLCAYILANPTSMVAMADCDGGGVDNLTECQNGADPTDPSDDCSLVMDGTVDVCAILMADPLNPLASSDCDGDGIDNATECSMGTSPIDECDFTYMMGTDVCAYVLANPTSPLALADCDGGGIDNLTECQNGTDPIDSSDDCDLIFDGSIDVCALLLSDPTNVLAALDCDGDGESNADECSAGTDPSDPCDNNFTTGAEICAYVLANPTSGLAMADCDGGGVDNLTECQNGNDPTDSSDDCDLALDGTVDICALLLADPTNGFATSDCDGDGIDNATECAAGTSPIDPCDNTYASGADMCIYILANPTSELALADCDGGGVDNLTECQNGNDPTDSGDDCDLALDGTVDICALLLADAMNGLATSDCDGDGIDNATECAAGTSPLDPCDNTYASGADMCIYILANPTSELALADCDGGGVDNLTECQNGNDPTDSGDDCDLALDGTVDICALLLADATNGFATSDCDGDGIDNATECAAGTSPLDPCDNTYASGADMCIYILANPTSELALADCDGGGVDNLTECQNGNDPTDSGDDCALALDGTVDICVLLADPTNGFASSDCDGDGIDNATECTAGTSPLDPCDNTYATGADMCVYILANPTSDLAMADCDGGGVDNLTECQNGADPLVPGDDCNLVLDGTIDVCALLDIDASNPLATSDCDGDGIDNATECDAGTSPIDPCDNTYATGAEVCAFVLANPGSALAMADCDGGGISNLIECTEGGDPLDITDDCSFVSGMVVDVCELLEMDPLNPLAIADCDGDGIDNATECDAGTDPLDPCDNTYATGADVCVFVLANPTSPLALSDCDGGGIDNLTECQNGNDPTDPSDDCDLVMSGVVDVCALLETYPLNPLGSQDCDGDGIDNATECAAGTSPLDPCDNTYASGADMCIYILANPTSELALADCDGGGVDNLTECQNGNDPTDSGDDCDLALDGTVDICALLLADATNGFATSDCDGDGIDNATECAAGTSPLDPCDNTYATGADACVYILANPTSDLATADCDGGGVDNLTECQNGNDPFDSTDECDLVMSGVIDVCALLAEDPSNPLATLDCDGGGVDNITECYGPGGPIEDPDNPGTYIPSDPDYVPLDPSDPNDDYDCETIVAAGVDICEYIGANPTSNIATLDCDGGGVDNITECYGPGGPIEDPDNPGTYIPSDPDYVPLDPSDPNDDYDCETIVAAGVDICEYIGANPTSNIATLDCDGGGVDNITECYGPGGPIEDPDNPGTYIPSDPDYVPLDPSDFTDDYDCETIVAAGVDICEYIGMFPTSNIATLDCDGGGVDNITECYGPGGPIEDPDSPGTYIPSDPDYVPLDPSDFTDDYDCETIVAAGVDICEYIGMFPTSNIATLDCDGGGVDNITECYGPGGPIEDPDNPGTYIPSDPEYVPLDPSDFTDDYDCETIIAAGVDICEYIGMFPTSNIATLDCDGGGVDNITECYGPGGPIEDPDNPGTYIPSDPEYVPLDPSDFTDDYDCETIVAAGVDICEYIGMFPTSNIATLDCDGGGVDNITECYGPGGPIEDPDNPGTYIPSDPDYVPLDPSDPNDDYDCETIVAAGVDICEYIGANPTSNIATLDCDDGGVDNITECYGPGGPIEDPDNPGTYIPSDPDYVPLDPSDPNDDYDCETIVAAGVDICEYIGANPTSNIATLDCDGGGVDNITECYGPGGPIEDPDNPGTYIPSDPDYVPLDPSDFTDDYDCETIVAAGVDICEYIGMFPTSNIATLDCDGGGVDNITECYGPGGPIEDPDNPGTYIPSDPDYVPLDPSDFTDDYDCETIVAAGVDICEYIGMFPTSNIATLDCDGGGVDNITECYGPGGPIEDPDNPGTYIPSDPDYVPLDPSDPNDDYDCETIVAAGVDICEYIGMFPMSNIATLDCDDGGVDNITECYGPGGPIEDPDNPGTYIPSDPDYVPLDPSDFADDYDCETIVAAGVDICEYIGMFPTSNIATLDCDGGGVDNITECYGPGGPIEDPDEPGTYIPSDPDYVPLDPSDPNDDYDCETIVAAGVDICEYIGMFPMSNIATLDCDDGGADNITECYGLGGGTIDPDTGLLIPDDGYTPLDPSDPSDDCYAFVNDGPALCDLLATDGNNPLAMLDCDGGGADNITECFGPDYVINPDGTVTITPGYTPIDPSDPSDDCGAFAMDGLALCELLTEDPTNPLATEDCDGGGVDNITECFGPDYEINSDGSFVITSGWVSLDPSASGDDCDLFMSDGPSLCDFLKANGNNPLATQDCDGGGVDNITECFGPDYVINADGSVDITDGWIPLDPSDPSDDCGELACLGNINLSLDETCSSEITPEMLLSVVSYSIEMYEIELKDEYGNVVDNNFDYTDIGKCFTFSISVPVCNGQSCWGNVCVEDKFIPSIDCGMPVTLPCNASEDDYPDPIVTDNCGGAELVMVNQTITPAECQDYLRVIERTFIAVDAEGNESAPCTQVITIDRVDLSGIQFPANFTSNVCTTSTDPLNTGVPIYKGDPIYPEVPAGLCNVFVTFEDIPLGSGDCNLSFMRRWNVGEWYCGTTVGPMTWVQMIEVNDLTPPSISCPANMTVTTSGGYGICEATVTLPPATANDDCNNPVEVNILGGPEVLFSNGGEMMLPVGTTTLTYVAYDGCYNSSTCEMTVTVADETQPTIVCKLNTVVSLQSTGLAEVLAEVFDNGSFDDCQIDRFEAARMDDICGVSGTDFGPSVTFCCADVGNEVMVRLRVYDSSGNHNECMVAVEVQDKEPATLSCPPNETVECTTPYDVTNLSIQFGTYEVDDNCADQLVTETVVEDIDQCGLGTVRRTFTMPDGLGGTLSCTQVISFTNSDPFDGDDSNDLIWPLDLTINGMCTVNDVHPDNLSAPFNFPIITEDACDLVGVNYEDQVFDFVAGEDACFKVLRTWKVVDWCQNVNGTFDTWEHEQIIKVTNNVAPTFVSGCEDQLVETLDCNAANVTLVATGSDDCTTAQGLGYSYTIENLGDGSTVATGNTNDASGSFELGIYEITWILLDGCGNEVTCSSTFEIRSNKAPVAYCIQGLSTELIMMDTDGDGIPDTEMVELWASDFDAGSYHPCGYAVTLSFSSDPTNTNITFDCSQQGQQGVQLWVTDENGNQTFCNTFVIVDDNDNSCPEMLIVDVQGRIFTEVNENVEDVEVELDGSADQDMTSEVGEYVFADMPIGGAYVIDPGKNDDVMNGVSTLDLVMIQKHLLQLRELDSPYKLIAADINHDEKVTAIDLIQLRKLILGVVEEFPANTSWRFVDALYEFPIPTDPWDEAFPEEYDIPALNTNMSIDFVGVKIGDVNGSVTANVTGDITENRSDKTLSLIYTDRLVQEGEQVIVPLRSSNFEQIAGLQLTLDHKGLILDRVEEGVLEMNSGNIGKLHDVQTTLSWNDRGGIQQTTKSADVLFNLVFTASETGRLSTMLSLSDQVIQTEAYRLLATTEYEEINISLDAEISNDDVFEGYTLHQNEPNPWSRMTAISIESIKDVEGTLTVKDALGKLIVSKDVALVTGLNELVLTKNDVPVGGVYYYTLTIGDVQLSKQMIRME